MINFQFDEAAIKKQAADDGVTHFATGIAIIKDDKVMVVKRATHDWLGGSYELPGGGVNAGETIVEGMIRELMEETGLKPKRIISTFKGFDYVTDKKPKVRQINFIVEPESYDMKLDSNEHSAYKWVGTKDYQDLVMSDEIKFCLNNLFQLQSR